MLDLGLTTGTRGNISVRCPESGLIYITPSAMDYGAVAREDIIVMDVSGNIIEGDRKPSIEKELHILIYRERSEINAVLHTHSLYSTVFAVLNESIPPVTDEAAQVLGESVKVAQYALPGTHALAVNCAQALGKSSMACLLANHGAVCIGGNLSKAFDVCTTLEATARIFYMARCIGNPVRLSGQTVQELYKFARESYGQ